MISVYTAIMQMGHVKTLSFARHHATWVVSTKFRQAEITELSVVIVDGVDGDLAVVWRRPQ